MLLIQKYVVLLLSVLFNIIVTASAANSSCKAVPGTSSWPSTSDWQSLNSSISGRLLQPPPPGAVCHPKQPTYNNATCVMVQKEWGTQAFHADNPISMDAPNFNNDSCLPDPKVPCSGAGYPIYVVNATTPQHVQAGVNFARQNNVRLVVKASGHDYLGRSTGPDSLSIWVHNIKGLNFSTNFQPTGCNYSLNSSAVTVGAGVFMGDIYQATAQHNLTVVGGMADHISVGGYATAAGHGPLSGTHGLAADNIFELEIVTPAGDLVIANECQHPNLFWAMRGGGGSSFGVITKATLRTFPSPNIGTYSFTLGMPASLDDAYWNVTTFLFQQLPSLVDQGISGYLFVVPAAAGQGGNALIGSMLSPNKTASAIEAALGPVVNYATLILPIKQILFQTNTTDYRSFYNFWFPSQDKSTVGSNTMLGSRILNQEVLGGSFEKLRAALQAFAGKGEFTANLISGPGVWNAKPRGGGNSVLPSWRNNSVVELVTATTWTPFNTSQENFALADLENRTNALRNFSPYTGTYLNEADVNEPHYQQTFWGDNYERLLEIKRSVDPGDVFWCHPCVGDEAWKVQAGGELCKV